MDPGRLPCPPRGRTAQGRHGVGQYLPCPGLAAAVRWLSAVRLGPGAGRGELGAVHPGEVRDHRTLTDERQSVSRRGWDPAAADRHRWSFTGAPAASARRGRAEGKALHFSDAIRRYDAGSTTLTSTAPGSSCV
ncbi:hypothetical protein MICRO11B_80049 [Micrococcus luteus]|nr:hypothetical protein MICRO11B_80049 [Micrococcus luteus]